MSEISNLNPDFPDDDLFSTAQAESPRASSLR